jgi:hypothetical protein
VGRRELEYPPSVEKGEVRRGAGPASEKSKRILGLLCTIRRELIRVIPFNETSIPTPNAWVRFENVNREA